MNDTSAAAEWLHQEALEHLDDDILGTYELLWLLSGSDYSLSDTQAKGLARATISTILAEREAAIVPLKWPGRERAGDRVDLAGLSDEQLFEFGEGGTYYAIMPTEDL